MYMAYVKSKRMGSKKRRVRKTRRIKGGLVEGKTIDDAIGMLDNVKQILLGMKTNSAPSSPPPSPPPVESTTESSAGASEQSSGNPVD